MSNHITAAIEQGLRMKHQLLELIRREDTDSESVCRVSRASKDLLHKQSIECIESGDHKAWSIHHQSYEVVSAIVDTWFATRRAGGN